MLTYYNVFLKSSPQYPFGQLNPAGYAPLGVTVAVIAVIAIFISAVGTRRQIPNLSVAPPRASVSPRTFRGIAATLANWNFMVIAISSLVYGINRGINEGLRSYVGTFFWQLPSEKDAVVESRPGAGKLYRSVVRAGAIAPLRQAAELCCGVHRRRGDRQPRLRRSIGRPDAAARHIGAAHRPAD